MNANSFSMAGPFTHENLTLFLVRGGEVLDGSRYLSLDEALEQKCVIVHETGQVGQLEVENLSETFDLYIQAGDVVKGGRQDRTLGVDFVLPAKSGRMPIPSFCVESGRWRRRAGESVEAFGSSKSYLSSKKLRMAAKLSRNQGEVWASVAETQTSLSDAMGKSLLCGASPTSYQLSVEDVDLQKRKEAYRAALAGIVEGEPRAAGYAFVINGEINTADVYGSQILFRKMWGKLLDAAILEAIAESGRQLTGEKKTVGTEEISRWFHEAEGAAVMEQREVPPRVRVETRRGEKSFVFETLDHGFNDAVLHRNLVMK